MAPGTGRGARVAGTGDPPASEVCSKVPHQFSEGEDGSSHPGLRRRVPAASCRCGGLVRMRRTCGRGRRPPRHQEGWASGTRTGLPSRLFPSRDPGVPREANPASTTIYILPYTILSRGNRTGQGCRAELGTRSDPQQQPTGTVIFGILFTAQLIDLCHVIGWVVWGGCK